MAESPAQGLELFPVDIGLYLHQEPAELEVAAEVGRMARVFARFGPDLRPWEPTPMEERTSVAARERLDEWAHGPVRDSILYWVGHGFWDGEDVALACYDTDGDPDKAVSPDALARRLQQRGETAQSCWSIVIVDTCRAGDLVLALDAWFKSKRRAVPLGMLVIGVTGSASTDLGRFAATLEDILASNFGEHPRITLLDLYGALNEELKDVGADFALNLTPEFALIPVASSAAGSTMEVQPKLREIKERIAAAMAEAPPAERALLEKAQTAGLGDTAWYFAGREEELATIATWVRESDSGLFVLSGVPGVGKSALLGNLFASSQPALRKRLEDERWMPRRSEEQRPPDGVFRTTIRLTGASTAALVDQLGAALGWTPPAGGGSAERLAALLTAAHGNGGGTIIVDALDEAQAPLAAARVIRTVADHGARIVVATRPATGGELDGHTERDDLLRALRGTDGSAPDGLVLARDKKGIRTFVEQRLDAWHQEARLVGDARFERVRDRITASIEERQRQFAFANLLVHEVTARPGCFDPEGDAELDELLGSDHRELFASAVERLSAERPAYGPALEVLALAFGLGIPLSDTMLAAAAGGPAGANLAEWERDIRQLLRYDAAPYVVIDAEDGQTVFRLAHDTFRRHFLDIPPEQLAAKHRAIVEALIDVVPRLEEGDDAEEINPYLRRYLAEHVARADGGWELLAERLDILDRLDPGAVVAAAQRGGLASLPKDIVAFVAVQDLLAASRPVDRPALRRIGRARAFGERALSGGPTTGSWRVRSAVLRSHPVHIIALRAEGALTSVVAFTLSQGRPIIAAGGDDGAIRLWDPWRGAPFGPPLADRASEPVRAMAVADSPAGPRLVVAHEGGAVRIWDPLSGRLLHVWASEQAARALAAWSHGDARLRIALASPDSVTVVTESGARVGRPIARRGVRALSRDAHRRMLVTGDDDDTVQVYALPDGEGDVGDAGGSPAMLWQRRLADDWVEAVEAVDVDGELVLAAGGDDAVLVLWRPEPTAEEPFSVLRGAKLHEGPILALTAIEVDGKALVATGGADATIRLWDAKTGAPWPVLDPDAENHAGGRPLTGHRGPVRSVASFVVEGVPRLATAADDGTVRVWDGAAAVAPFGAGLAKVLAVAAVERPSHPPIVVTGDDKGALTSWDAETGARLGGVDRAHRGAVRALLTLADGRLVSGSDDEEVCVWDVAGDGSLTVVAKHGEHRGPIRAFAPLPDGFASGDSSGLVVRRDGAGNPTPMRYRFDGPVRGLALAGHVLAVVGHGRDVAFESLSNSAVLPPGRAARDWLMAACGVPRLGIAMAAGDDGHVYGWRVKDGSHAITLTGHLGSVRSLALHEVDERRRLVSGGADGTVRLWDLDTEDADVIRLGVPVNAVAVVTGGIVVGTDEGHLVLDLG